ncbi:MAG: hypothetical protein Q4G05_06535 [Clostridia bacterium]|nr:hypothetical protein [Clostridia bacterium]
MSKLYDKYLLLKSDTSYSENTLFLFKSGIFFIFIDEDARIISNILNLRLTHLTDKVMKCGFPSSSIEKYLELFKHLPYTIKVIDNPKNITYTPRDFSLDNKVKNLLSDLVNVNTDTLSVREAYDFIENIQKRAKTMEKEYINNE